MKTKQVGTVAPRGPLPTIALSIRQPWAWLIVNGYKDVENRSRCIKKFCGPVLIHASAQMIKADYEACLIFVSSISGLIAEEIPDFAEFHQGGIVGSAYILSHGNWPLQTPWWTGPYGYQFIERRPLPFKPCKGHLGFFPCNYDAL